MKNNFYIFIDKGYLQLLEIMIRDRRNIKLIPFSFSDLRMEGYHTEIRRIMSLPSYRAVLKDPDCPEVSVPEYNVVVNSKVDLVYQAVLDNPFQSDYFVWMDAGYGHGKISVPELWNPVNMTSVTDKITQIFLKDPANINPDYRQFFEEHTDFVIGGVWGCPKSLIEQYHTIFYNTISEYTALGITDDDQYTTSMVYTKHPELFNVHINGDWYCAFYELK